MTISLKQGNYYKTVSGDLAFCVGKDPFPNQTEDIFIVVVHENGRSHKLYHYFENGNWMENEQKENYPMDIVEEVGK